MVNVPHHHNDRRTLFRLAGSSGFCSVFEVGGKDVLLHHGFPLECPYPARPLPPFEFNLLGLIRHDAFEH